MKTLTPKRYEIYYADLNPAVGCEIKKIRPVVVISHDSMNKNLDTVVVCPLTKRLHLQWRSRVQIKCSGKTAEVAVDQIRTISKKRLKQKVDKLSSEEALQLRRLITEMYGE
ncbi:MAG: transcription elongation factor GreAB [Planctomycetes bacterium RBG_16_41_13]|nr:MAG: transcription elongation factor GreAB [Planctomycetes bacterium RBG_16_41_13]